MVRPQGMGGGLPSEMGIGGGRPIPAGPRPVAVWDPGQGDNLEPAKMACPLCQSNFKTQKELELHCAQCTGTS